MSTIFLYIYTCTHSTCVTSESTFLSVSANTECAEVQYACVCLFCAQSYLTAFSISPE